MQESHATIGCYAPQYVEKLAASEVAVVIEIESIQEDENKPKNDKYVNSIIKHKVIMNLKGDFGDFYEVEDTFAHEYDISNLIGEQRVAYLSEYRGILVEDSCWAWSGDSQPLSEIIEYSKQQNLLPTPREQVQNNILPMDVQCRWSLYPIIKHTGDSTACVTYHTLSKLVNAGWAGKDNISVKIITDKLEYKLGEDIIISMKNQGFVPIIFPSPPDLFILNQTNDQIVEWNPLQGDVLNPSSLYRIVPGEESILYIWDQKTPLVDIPWIQTSIELNKMENYHTEEYRAVWSDYLTLNKDHVYRLNSGHAQYYKVPRGDQVDPGEYFIKINYGINNESDSQKWSDTVVYPIKITE
jgi:hypothetical protein